MVMVRREDVENGVLWVQIIRKRVEFIGKAWKFKAGFNVQPP